MPDQPRKIPKWADNPFQDFRQHTMEIGDVLHLACDGIAMLRGRPQALEALASASTVLQEAQSEGEEQDSGRDYLASLDDAKRQAELAEREVQRSFPLLHAQAAVSLWASLETLIENFAAAWIANQPTAQNIEVVRKLKIPLWQFNEMNSGERSLYSVELLQRELDSSLKHGITGFESLLDLFGLGGGTDEDVGKDIFELNHMRNVLVHRRGLADRRLVEACPWLDLTVGERVQITHDAFSRYYMSVVKYFFEVYNRVRAYFGAKRLDPWKQRGDS